MAKLNKQTQEQVQVQAQEQVQVQTLTPQQVMLVRLTEMPIEALQQRIDNECLENPWLEKAPSLDPSPEEEGSWAAEGPLSSERGEGGEASYDYRSEDDIPDYMLRSTYTKNMPENVEYGDTLTFYDQLKAQMSDFDLTEREQQLLEYLIGELDGNGLLGKPLIQIVDEAEIYQGVETTEKEMLRILAILQQFEPAGVGARSLQECLVLQIKRDTKNPYQRLMLQVMEKYYDDFLHKRWGDIQRKLKLSAIQLEELKREIKRLNPRPGSSVGEKSVLIGHQILPDFIVETDEDGHITMQLNGGNPSSLVISPDATEMLQTYENIAVEQGRAGRNKVHARIRGARPYLHRCPCTAQGEYDQDHERHHKAAAPLLPGRRRYIAQAHEAGGCCQSGRLRHQYREPCVQQQVCADAFRHLFPEAFLYP